MLAYRPDIDGLRAIAVISVVLFHLEKSLLPGGFIGVDIFFVISGYLITNLIHKQLQANDSFSFRDFYLRRLRRLFPALFVTLVFSSLLAIKLLAPADLVEFAKSLVASVFSVSNIFFWDVANYFDSDSDLKPLLHTWSLSIEEQFYFIWPMILVFLFNRKKAFLIPGFIVVMGLASLALNHVFFAHSTKILSLFSRVESFDISSTAFYWLPFRVFEFSVGAIVVWLTSLHSAKRHSSSLFAELIFVMGLAMIAWSFWQLDSTQAFPSWNALVPCVGAALIIYSGSGFTEPGVGHRLMRLLSNRFMVGVGLISYSLYLIHWPVIVFYKYWSDKEFSILEMIGLVTLSVILAVLMYRFVEQPFRKPQKNNKKFVFSALTMAVLLVSVSVHAASSGGWLWRYPSDVIAQLSYKHGDYTEYFWKSFNEFDRPFKDNGKPKVLIIGDSMAADISNVLVAGQYTEKVDISSIVIGDNCKGVFPISDEQYQVLYQHRAEICRAQHQKILNQEKLLTQADTIILASYWWDDYWFKYVGSTVSYLNSISDAQLLVSGLKNQINNGIWFLSKNAFARDVDKLRTPLDQQSAKVNRRLSQAAVDYRYFDLVNGFCNTQGCQRVTEDGYVIVFDQSHLSEKGAKHVASNIAQETWLKALLGHRKNATKRKQ